MLLVAVIGLLAWKYQQASKGTDNDNKKTSARIVSEVANLYMLPTGEEPTVALIQDKTKLGNQDFFRHAQNGDYLLIYKKEKIALVYREETDKLIAVGPVNIGDTNNSGQTAGAQTDTQAP